MLKRILLAVSILALGFIFVVGFVNVELKSISSSVANLTEVIIPMSRGAENSSDHTAQIMLAVSDFFQADTITKRDEIRATAAEAARGLKKDVAELSGARFMSQHRLNVAVPQETEDGSAAPAKQEALITLLGELSGSAAHLEEMMVSTMELGQKQADARVALKVAQEELSRVFRSSAALAAVDAKAYNAVTRSILVVMFSHSIGDTSTARAKFEDGMKALSKGSLTPEQETMASELKASFQKTYDLLVSTIANGDDVVLFMKGTPGAEKCGFRFYSHTCASFVGCFTAVCRAQPSPFVE
jgi:uncharacterized protein YoxC